MSDVEEAEAERTSARSEVNTRTMRTCSTERQHQFRCYQAGSSVQLTDDLGRLASARDQYHEDVGLEVNSLVAKLAGS